MKFKYENLCVYIYNVCVGVYTCFICCFQTISFKSITCIYPILTWDSSFEILFFVEGKDKIFSNRARNIAILKRYNSFFFF